MKTDRIDARKLAHLHRAGDLVAVHIPDMEDEVIRDIGRCRTDAVNETKRTKQQLKSFSRETFSVLSPCSFMQFTLP